MSQQKKKKPGPKQCPGSGMVLQLDAGVRNSCLGSLLATEPQCCQAKTVALFFDVQLLRYPNLLTQDPL